MVVVKSKILFFAVCMFEAIWLLLAQVSGSMILLLPCLVCFLGLAVLSAVKGTVIPMLLFFLPFAPLLKIQPGTISFYTIALLAVYMVYIVMGSRNINIHHLIPGLALIAFVLVVKTLYGYTIENSFILFSVSILLTPFLARELSGDYDFYYLTLFFALGIATAAITSQFLTSFSSISRYIAAHVFSGGVRRAGYYGDPNFYSSHISAALGGVLVLILNNTNKKRMIVLALLAMILLYCGFMSVSKTFLVITVCLFLFLGVAFMFQKGKLSAKLMMIFSLVVGIGFLLSLTVFNDLISMMVSRLSRDHNLSDFTTGRVDLWMQYLKAFADDPLLLIFGKGFTKILVNDRASHNTIIQVFYQFGIVGCVFLFSWIVCYVKTLLSGLKIRWNNLAQILILLIGSFGPWLALDFLFFDEFFLIPIYACFAIRYLNQKPAVGNALI